MKVSLNFSPAHLKTLRGKLDAWQRELTDKNGAVVEFLVEEVGEDYRKAVVSGMGVVKPSGGSAQLAPFLGSPSAAVTFHGLSNKTQRKKAESNMELNIWMATGKTSRAVKVHEPVQRGHRVEVFSGILGSTHREELEKALAVEFGFSSESIKEHWEGRPLFTVLNRVLKDQRALILKKVQAAAVKAARKVGWGR